VFGFAPPYPTYGVIEKITPNGEQFSRDAVKISGLNVPAMMSGRDSQEFRLDFMIGSPGKGHECGLISV